MTRVADVSVSDNPEDENESKAPDRKGGSISRLAVRGLVFVFLSYFLLAVIIDRVSTKSKY